VAGTTRQTDATGKKQKRAARERTHHQPTRDEPDDWQEQKEGKKINAGREHVTGEARGEHTSREHTTDWGGGATGEGAWSTRKNRQRPTPPPPPTEQQPKKQEKGRKNTPQARGKQDWPRGDNRGENQERTRIQNRETQRGENGGGVKWGDGGG